MARRTFGPAGQVITVSDAASEISNQNITITEAESGESDFDPGTIEHVDNADGSREQIDTGQIGERFERIGESVTSSPVPESGTYTDPNNATVPKRRGRKPGTKNRPKSDNTESTADKTAFITTNLEKVLYNLHALGSKMLDIPELNIGKDGAELLAEGIKEVAAEYDFSSIMSRKTAAWIDLGIACVSVYTPLAITLINGKPKPQRVVTVMPPAHQQTNVQ